MKIYTEPVVTLLSKPTFAEPEHLRCDWAGDVGSTGARLVEYAGRLCYMSYHNPARRSSQEYITNILTQRHGSVLEHANFSVLVEGLSRSCSHELVRHRAGFAYSQLSQRYVDESDCAFVMPPLVRDQPPEARVAWIRMVEEAAANYTVLSDQLETPARTRKQVREASRSVLPNATETKIVMTANARAWRHMLEMRTSPHADREIRELAIAILRLFQQEAPEFFQDFTITDDGLGAYQATPGFSKV